MPTMPTCALYLSRFSRGFSFPPIHTIFRDHGSRKEVSFLPFRVASPLLSFFHAGDVPASRTIGRFPLCRPPQFPFSPEVFRIQDLRVPLRRADPTYLKPIPAFLSVLCWIRCCLRTCSTFILSKFLKRFSTVNIIFIFSFFLLFSAPSFFV